MIQITEVSIISIDKSDDSWAIEGEILFEEDLSTAFEATYLCDEDEIEDIFLELDPGVYDEKQLSQMIKAAAFEYDE